MCVLTVTVKILNTNVWSKEISLFAILVVFSYYGYSVLFP